MNRHINLLTSIHSWINLAIDEIIIIDWCSKTEFSTIIPYYLTQNPNFSKIKIFRVDGFDKWVLTWAFNLGFSLAKGDYILKLDADIIVDENFLEKNPLIENVYYRGAWIKNKPHLTGQFLCKKSILEEIGYYNEIITSYGYDDIDLYNRIKITPRKINGLQHLYNDNYSRVKYQDSDNIDGENSYNELKSKLLAPIPFDKSRFRQNSDGSFTIIKKDLYYNEKLHQETEKINERKMFKIKELPERFLILKVFGSIERKLSSILSYITFCKLNNYKLYVIWNDEESNFYDFFGFRIQLLREEEIDKSIIYGDDKLFIESDNELDYKHLYDLVKPSIKLSLIMDYISKYVLKEKKYNVIYDKNVIKCQVENEIIIINEQNRCILCDAIDFFLIKNCVKFYGDLNCSDLMKMAVTIFEKPLFLDSHTIMLTNY